jgi:trimethylamine--corrinoid protein Co-methyltransferase
MTKNDSAKREYFQDWNENAFGNIHDGVCQVLEKVGVLLKNQEARNILKKNGCKIDGEKVFFSNKIVEKSLKSMPKKLTIKGRDPNKKFQIGDSFSFTLSAPSGAAFVTCMHKGRRPGNMEDAIAIQKYLHMSKARPMVGHVGVELQDIPKNIRHLYVQYNNLSLSDKPQAGYFSPEPNASWEIIEMLSIVYGGDSVLENNHIITQVLGFNSPLCLDHSIANYIINYSKNNQTTMIFSVPTMGVLSPASCEGTMVQVFAELISATVLTQVIRPGLPIIWVPGPTPADMKNFHFNMAAADTTVISGLCIKMAKEFYHALCAGITATTDANDFDVQLGLEHMQQTLQVAIMGADCAVGDSYSSGMITSLEQYPLDEEIFTRVSLFLKQATSGVFNKAELNRGIQSIIKAGPMGNYLMDPTTLRLYKGFWRPTVCNWENWDEWYAEGARSLTEKCYDLFWEKVRNSPENTLTPEVDRDLKKYIQKHTEIH